MILFNGDTMRIFTTAAQQSEIRALLNRRPNPQADSGELTARVAGIIGKVRQEGNRALLEYAARFDHVDLTAETLRVTPAELEAASREVGAAFRDAVRTAKRNILDFHAKQYPKDWLDIKADGILLGQRYLPVAAAGLYVPGGTAGTTPLVSSVLMNALPAIVAGVERIVICTPPNATGSVNPHLLATAAECNIGEVYKIGGAQAVAALAFGTETMAPVDVIVGPGNQYVTEAKRQVFGYVGIDMLAGPSEILVIADAANNPVFVAADLISQAEHGPAGENGSFLLTPSRPLAEAVAIEVERQLAELNRNEIARASLEQGGGIIITQDLDEAFALANYTAPEHLELLVRDPWNHLSRIRHAGAVFIGPFSTEPIGDYVAGSNHVLPTSGTARFASGLNVDHFMKKTSLICYNQAGIQRYGPAAVSLAEVEGLDGHANAVKVRMKVNDN